MLESVQYCSSVKKKQQTVLKVIEMKRVEEEQEEDDDEDGDDGEEEEGEKEKEKLPFHSSITTINEEEKKR